MLSPPALLLLLYIISKALEDNRGILGDVVDIKRADAHSLSNIPQCETDPFITDTPCYDFIYTPDDSDVVEVSYSSLMRLPSL